MSLAKVRRIHARTRLMTYTAVLAAAALTLGAASCAGTCR